MSVDVCNRTCDEVEAELVVIIEQHVASEHIDTAVDLLVQLTEFDRNVEQEGCSANSSHRLELIAMKRREITKQFDDISDEIRLVIQDDSTAKELLDSLSRQESCQNSAIRDALHLIRDARLDDQTSDISSVPEMVVV